MEYFSKYELQILKCMKKIYKRDCRIVFDTPRYNILNEQGKPILDGTPPMLRRSFEALVVRGYLTKYHDRHLCDHPQFQLTEKALNAFNAPPKLKLFEEPEE